MKKIDIGDVHRVNSEWLWKPWISIFQRNASEVMKNDKNSIPYRLNFNQHEKYNAIRILKLMMTYRYEKQFYWKAIGF